MTSNSQRLELWCSKCLQGHRLRLLSKPQFVKTAAVLITMTVLISNRLLSKLVNSSGDLMWNAAEGAFGRTFQPGELDAHLSSVCPTMLRGNTEGNVSSFVADDRVVEVRAEEYLLKSCAAIRSMYLLDPNWLPQDELNVSLAFGILMYKDVWQFERLLRAIYRPHHTYCVHVDNKSDPTVLLAVRRVASCFDNVFVPTDNVRLDYGAITQVDAELACMREALRRSEKWSWYINLTGQEFPLKTMWQLVRILKALNGTNSVHIGGDSWAQNRKQPIRPFTDKFNMTPSSGATHLLVVRGFVQFAATSQLASQFRDTLVGSDAPDEIFFNTLNNSPVLAIPGATTIKNDPEGTVDFINRLKHFRGGANPPCLSNHFVHEVCIYGVADLPHVTNPLRKQLFVNKLYWHFQHFALDCLEWWYYNNTISEYSDYRSKKTNGLPVDIQFYVKYKEQFGPRI